MELPLENKVESTFHPAYEEKFQWDRSSKRNKTMKVIEENKKILILIPKGIRPFPLYNKIQKPLKKKLINLAT